MTTIEVTEAWTGPGRRDERIVTPPPAENGAHPSDQRRAFEHWYFDARLDDGHVVIGFLQAADLVTGKPGVELHVYRPDGERLEIRKRYPVSAVRAATDQCDVRVGHNFAVADFPAGGGLPVHRVHLEENDLRFDLEFHSEVPAWQPGAGRTNYGERDYFAWIVGAPRARVTGTVQIGDTTLEARGIGYHDHNWGVGDMKRIVDHWYWGRLYAEDFTLIYANVFAQKRYGSQCSTPLMVAHGDEVILSTGEVTIEEGPPVYDARADNAYPRDLVLRADGAELRLDVREVIHAHDLLDDVPVVRHKLVKPVAKPLINRLVGRPGYFRFRSDFVLRLDASGTQAERKGSTIHEMVALR